MANIITNMFENSITVSVIILILFLMRPFLSKRYTAKWRYGVWLALTIRLLVPFDIEIPSFTAPVNIPVENKVVYQVSADSEYGDIISTPSKGEESDNITETPTADNQLKEKPPPEFYDLINEINRIGININQIAHVANMTGKIDVYRYEDNIKDLKKIIKLIKEKYL